MINLDKLSFTQEPVCIHIPQQRQKRHGTRTVVI